MKFTQEFREAGLVHGVMAELRRTLSRPWVLMEICGGQTHAIMHYGLDQLLPAEIELVHGPGCPVCVTALELVDKGLALTRQKAQAMIMAGLVRIDDRPADKPGIQVRVDASVTAGDPCPYVSRGGLKLEGALSAFGLDVTGFVCLDVGASTGGFTHCLLSRGASRVYAVDVGYGQLAWELRQDPRVVTIERTNIRHMAPGALPEPVDLAVILAPARVVPSLVRECGQVSHFWRLFSSCRSWRVWRW